MRFKGGGGSKLMLSLPPGKREEAVGLSYSEVFLWMATGSCSGNDFAARKASNHSTNKRILVANSFSSII